MMPPLIGGLREDSAEQAPQRALALRMVNDFAALYGAVRMRWWHVACAPAPAPAPGISC